MPLIRRSVARMAVSQKQSLYLERAIAMKSRRTKVVASLFALASLLVFSLLALAGDLEPSGPPGPTMKTLQQVEPRTPIAQSDVPYTITKPGSYYLAENLFALGAGQDCITVNASDVTLDLRGFAISNTEVFVFNRDIVIDDTETNVTITNGTIRRCLAEGITSDSAFSFPKGVHISDVRVLSNGSEGIHLGDACTVTGSLAVDNDSHGIRVEDHGKVIDCTAETNDGYGILTANAGLVKNCIANGNNGNGGISVNNQSTITGCAVTDNNNTGIHAYSSQVSNCTVTFCAGNGFDIAGSSVSACTSRQNDGIGFNANGNSNLTDCHSYKNGQEGIVAAVGTSVTQCTAAENTLDGIRVGSDCYILNNNCHDNGSGGSGAGIHVTGSDNRIEGNNATDNDRGVGVDTADNIIIRNTTSGNSVLNYDIAAGNHYGQIISTPGAGFTGADTNYNPWANFEF
jgi:parallel beta-helix repeat protein